MVEPVVFQKQNFTLWRNVLAIALASISCPMRYSRSFKRYVATTDSDKEVCKRFRGKQILVARRPRYVYSPLSRRTYSLNVRPTIERCQRFSKRTETAMRRVRRGKYLSNQSVSWFFLIEDVKGELD